MNELNDSWFRSNGFFIETIGNDNYFYKSRYDMRYLFKFREFANDWGFYVEYMDSPLDSDEGMKHPVLFGLKTTEHVERLWELITLS
jgi:hypothetical protein